VAESVDSDMTGGFDPDVSEGSESDVSEPVDPDVVEPVDPDVVEDLGDEIATLAAHLHAGTHQLLTLLAEFDRMRGWELGGHYNCAHWLSFRTGLDLGTAREHVRVARALEELPETGAAMARGALSFSQVRALTRVAEAETEADLLELAQGCTTAQLERMVRAWRKGSRADEAEWERERHRSRTLSVFPDDDGMYVVQGRLDPEVGALLMRAVEAASDALYRERRRVPERAPVEAPGDAVEKAAGDARGGVHDTGREAARRRADAVGLLAERALAAGFGGREPVEARSGADASDERGCARRREVTEVPISGTRAERYQVVLLVDHETLAEEGEPGRSELEDGTRVSAETSRRVSCDAGLVRLTRARDGSGDGRRRPTLNLGRRTRTVSPALRRALEVRDRGCRFPGCGLRFTEAHHVVHWADGGETSLDNTVLLCRYHHRLVHEDGWRVEWWGIGRAAFRDPRGSVHMAGRERLPPRLPGGPGGPDGPGGPRDPVATLARQNRLRGAEPDVWTASARWKREVDIPDDVFFRATEAAM
jgi:hypothetical protein